MGRAALIVVIASLIAVGDALACSCAADVDEQTRLREADGAFVGTVVSKRTQGDRAWTTFSVEERYKGDLGPTVEVETGGDTNSCAIRGKAGDRVALYLRAHEGTWHAGTCDLTTADALREATRGSMRTLVAGTFRGSRLLAIDGAGRVIGFGPGGGDGQQIDVCPDSLRSVEVYLQNGAYRLAVRELPSLRVLRDVALRGSPDHVLVHCQDRSGKRPTVIARDGGVVVVERISGEGWKRLFSGRARAYGFGHGTAYLATPSRLLAVETFGGRRRSRGRVRGLFGELSGGPDGQVAGRAGDRVVVVSADGIRRVRADNVERPLVWTAGLPRPYLASGHSGGRVLVFDRALRRRDVFSGFPAVQMVARDSRLWGFDAEGSLLTARLPGGPGQVVGRLPAGAPRDIAAVRQSPRASQARISSPCSSSAGGFKRI